MATPSKRLRVVVLFGGRSAEHDVSVLSATNVLQALDPAKYEAVPVFVTRKGRWLLSDFEGGMLAQPSSGTELCLLPGGQGRMMAVPQDGPPCEMAAVDVLLPVLHGLHGEDGAVQGLAEVAGLPLAGCGILGSAIALDKDVAKRLLNEAKLPVARSVTIHRDAPPDFANLQGALGLPVFVKPARQGSSVGVSKVFGPEDYAAALARGFEHDSKLLAEEFIRGREIECGVLEDARGIVFVSRPGEVLPSEKHGFYSYEAKYVDKDGALLEVPAELPGDVEDKVREIAAKAFRVLGCDAMARVDFFVTADGRILVNEVNTIPGFTEISMYSKVLEASGISHAEILDRLIAHGLARAGRAG